MSTELIDRDRAIRIAEQGQVKGFEWQLKQLVTEPPVKAIPIEKLEQIRAEIENLSTDSYITDGVTCYGQRPLTAKEFKRKVSEIIDKAIKEAVDE